MAGSLNHIIDDDTGGFSMGTIDNMGDAHEALEDCYDIIALLLDRIPNPHAALQQVCKQVQTPMPKQLPKFGKREE